MNPIKIDDFYSYRYLSNLKYAPDGSAAAFVVAQADPEENGYQRHIYLYRDGAVRRLTGLGDEGEFIWLDAGHIMFPAERSAAEKKRSEAHESFTSFYKIAIDGGEAEPYFTLPFDAGDIWPLDAAHFVTTGYIDAAHADYYAMDKDARAAVDKAIQDEKDYEVFDEIPFWSNGGGVTNKHRNALFAVELVDGAPVVKRITGALESVSNVEPVGDEILFNSNEYSGKRRIYGCDIKAYNWRTGELRTVFSDDRLMLEALKAADGVVYALMNDGAQHGINENSHVYALDVINGELTLVRAEEYVMYGDVGSDCRLGGGDELAAYGDGLLYVTTREGDALLYRLNRDGSTAPVVTKKGSIDCFAVHPNGDKALMIAMYDMGLQELYECELAGGEPVRVSHFNDAILADKYVAQPVHIETESEGYTIGGWVLPPKDYDPAQRYPAVLDIHGGPKTVYGEVFYHEMQLWANMGYFVFCCNPKGSDGRDSDFMDIRGHYGDTDYKNIMDFTDAVLRAYPQIDAKRVCVTGGSYGGFMTNWIIGHTDRFCCAASQRSISNWLSFYGVSDIGTFFGEDQTGATPYDGAERMWAQSPLKYAKNAVTPTLFIHSDEDYRCPLEQGLQMFTALRDNGVEARLCMFHDENHELSRGGKPKHRLRRLSEITDWFEKYAK